MHTLGNMRVAMDRNAETGRQYEAVFAVPGAQRTLGYVDLSRAAQPANQPKHPALVRLRFKRVHPAAATDELRQGKGVHAIACADVEHLIAGADYRLQPHDFRLDDAEPGKLQQDFMQSTWAQETRRSVDCGHAASRYASSLVACRVKAGKRLGVVIVLPLSLILDGL